MIMDAHAFLIGEMSYADEIRLMRRIFPIMTACNIVLFFKNW